MPSRSSTSYAIADRRTSSRCSWRRATPPPVLARAEPIDFTDPAGFERAFAALVQRLCPPGATRAADAEAAVGEAWEAALAADPGGFDAEPSPERDGLLDALLTFDIADPLAEGAALSGFAHAARLLLRDHEVDHPAAYNMKMLLGECLAVGLHRCALYRQVAERYLDHEAARGDDPVLAFVVVRASSKLAELDPALLDLGALLRIATALDARAPLTGPKEAVASLLGRIAAKLRGSDLGDLLIRALSDGGPAARIAAIGGISTAATSAPSVFYLGALAELHAGGGAPRGVMLEPPSRRLQALLFAIDLDQPTVVARRLELAKADLRRDFGIDDLAYGHTWLALRDEPPPESPHRVPFVGTVVKATRANMEELALRVKPSHVVCLTEPRVVDALFEHSGSLLVPLDEAGAQRRRLAGRGVPFGALDAARMADLREGAHIVVETGRLRVVSQP